MSNNPTLSETGAAVLRAAADHPARVAVPPERLPAASRNAVIASLLRAGLLEEVGPTGEGSLRVLRITQVGLAAIGQEPRAEGEEHDTSTNKETTAAEPAHRTLRGAAGAVLAAWDAGEGREGLRSAVEAVRAALARRRAEGAPRAPTGPRKPREGTKQATVLALLRHPEGTTITAMMEATGWQTHTVRGFLAGLKKRGHVVEVLDRVRQVGSGKAGARGSYSVYRVSDAAMAGGQG